MASNRAVQRTSELDRIAALPRRKWQGDDLVGPLTDLLRRPGGTMVLRPVQAAALAEAHDHRGLFLQAEMGAGKTLVSALLPTILEEERPLLLVPAALRDEKTIPEFRQLSEHWRLKPVRIESYTRMCRNSAAALLESYRPDLIILDEAQYAKNPRAAVTRRLRRYVHACRSEGRPLIFCAMTGTSAKRSICDFAHFLEWALGDGSPLPLVEDDLIDWSLAIDERVPEESRLDPGALLTFGTPVREALGRRIFETPGVISAEDVDTHVPLSIALESLPLSSAEDAAFEQLRTAWETPDGHPIADAVGLWRHARELALSFFYRWDPRPPREWLDARKEWCAAVREELAHNRRALDTEFQVAEEIRQKGEAHKLWRLYDRWSRIRDTFVPNTVAQWTGDTALRRAQDFLEAEQGVVWVEHRAFGSELSRRSGRPYYGAGGLDAQGRTIELARGPIIASIASCGTGRNLQRWHQGYVSSCKPTGTIWQQLLARLHRPLQERPVHFTVPISCREQLYGFAQARADATFHKGLLTTRQKLCYASVVTPTIPMTGWAWLEQKKDGTT